MVRGRMRPFVILKAPALPRTVSFFFYAIREASFIASGRPELCTFLAKNNYEFARSGRTHSNLTFPNAAGPSESQLPKNKAVRKIQKCGLSVSALISM